MKFLILFVFCFALPLLAQQKHGTGLKFDPEKYATFPQALAPLKEDVKLPAKIDLSPDMPPIGNQGYQGSCVAWAIAYALKSYQEKLEGKYSYSSASGMLDQKKVFSPAFIYNQTYLDVNSRNQQGFDGGGSYMWRALDFLKTYGVVSLAEMPYNVKDFKTHPSRSAVEKAKPYRIAYWKTLDPKQLDAVKSNLAQKIPVVIGAYVDSGFMRLKGQNSVYRSITDNKGGGHAMCLVGYDDSKRAFKVMNSWGTAWGDKGYGWISYALFPKVVREAYIAIDEKNQIEGKKILSSNKMPKLIESLYKQLKTTTEIGVTCQNLRCKDPRIAMILDSMNVLIKDAVSENKGFAQGISEEEYIARATNDEELYGVKPAEAEIFGKLVLANANSVRLSLNISRRGRTYTKVAEFSCKELGIDLGKTDISKKAENVEKSQENREKIRIVQKQIPNRKIGLNLFTKDSRRFYNESELVPLAITADRDCHILMYVRQLDGTEVLLYPNEHKKSTLLRKGEILTIPEIEVAAPFGRDMVQVIACNNQNELMKLIRKKEALGTFSILESGFIANGTNGLRIRKTSHLWGTAILEINTSRK